ncbi:MAG: alpha/beta hydrolase, partial [Burkholderiales bacterium]
QYNVRAAIPEHPQIFARWKDRSQAARRALPCELDVAYGSGPNETLDIFPARGRCRALLTFIHGGFWRALDKSDFSFIAGPYIERGVTVAVINYALAPAVTVETIVQQMLAAHAWIYHRCERYGTPRSRIYVSGHSAGGHLTAMMLAAAWSAYSKDLPNDLVKGGLAVSGIYDLEPLLHVSFNSDMRLDAAAVKKLSPIRYRPLRAVPLYTSVGGAESAEFRRQNGLIGATWDHCFRRDIPMPGFHHLGVVEQLGEAGSALCGGALQMMQV